MDLPEYTTEHGKPYAPVVTFTSTWKARKSAFVS